MTAVSGLKDFALWQASENYLNVGKQTYDVHLINEKVIHITPSSYKPKWIFTVLKIISYITVILPLIALVIKTIYRNKYHFKPWIEPIELLTEPFVYKNTINKIRSSHNAGLKTALFVGRDDTQSIPNQEKWLWTSLDRQMQNAFDPNRPHLQMDFNCEPEMELLKHHFNKVVVDVSVLKFFDDPWNTLKSLLVPNSDSELIVEARSGVIYHNTVDEPKYDIDHATFYKPLFARRDLDRAAEKIFQNLKKQIGESVLEKQYQQYRSTLSEEEEEEIVRYRFMWKILGEKKLEPKEFPYEEELFKRTKIHLETLFDSVVLKKGRYPYQNRWDSDDFQYWVCRSPKH